MRSKRFEKEGTRSHKSNGASNKLATNDKKRRNNTFMTYVKFHLLISKSNWKRSEKRTRFFKYKHTAIKSIWGSLFSYTVLCVRVRVWFSFLFFWHLVVGFGYTCIRFFCCLWSFKPSERPKMHDACWFEEAQCVWWNPNAQRTRSNGCFFSSREPPTQECVHWPLDNSEEWLRIFGYFLLALRSFSFVSMHRCGRMNAYRIQDIIVVSFLFLDWIHLDLLYHHFYHTRQHVRLNGSKLICLFLEIEENVLSTLQIGSIQSTECFSVHLALRTDNKDKNNTI